jgi:hypothetical protein
MGTVMGEKSADEALIPAERIEQSIFVTKLSFNIDGFDIA